MENNPLINNSYSAIGSESSETYRYVDNVIQYLEEYSRTWSDESYSLFLKSFNEYLAQIVPIEYKRPVIKADSLYDLLPLWGIRFNRDKLRQLLIKLAETRRAPNYANIIELRELLSSFLADIGVEDADDTLRQCSEHEREDECLSYLAILALVIATNP